MIETAFSLVTGKSGEVADSTQTHLWISWNGNIRHRYRRLYRPVNEQELAATIRDSKSVRVIGNGQSSADIAGGTEDLISLEHMNGVLEVDHKKREITAAPGIRLAQLLRKIDELGWTLSALPDIDTVTLGGVLATATHGTAGAGRILGDHMVRCRLITANGSIEEIFEDDPRMAALRVSLGVLGIFSSITLKCDPQFKLAVREQPVPDSEWIDNFSSLLQEYPFVRVLSLPHTGIGYQITGRYAHKPEDGPTAPLYVKYRRSVSAQLYRWTVRFPSFTVTANRLIQKLFFNHVQTGFGTLYEATVTKSRGSTLELAEWTVAAKAFPALYRELSASLNDHNNRAFAHIPMDIRFLKADTNWLSYAYEQDCITVGCVTRTPAHAAEYAAFEVIEEIFRRYQGRPHWAKRHSMRGDDFAAVYPRWNDFLQLRHKMDPSGKFLNNYLRTLLKVPQARQGT